MKLFFQKLINKLGFELRRTGARAVFWKDDSRFYTLFKSVQSRMAIKEDRAFMLYQFAQYAHAVDGEAAQLGVYRGGSSKVIAQGLKGSGKKLYLFDTYEGLPVKPGTFSDGRSEFVDTSYDEVKRFLEGEPVTLVKGFFPDTAEPYAGMKFSFVYLDADLEDSTRAGLEFFYPRLTPGGVLFSDDYGSPYWPGVKKCVDEFAQKHKLTVLRPAFNQCLLIKPRA